MVPRALTTHLVWSALLTSGVLTLTPLSTAQNSTEKIRATPSALAARAGSAVPWRADLNAALAESQSSGKPVFWYVPTIRGSFMDRNPEVDRSMLAGPFSWPRLIALLGDHYIPVRAPASKVECERYGLKPIEFIEPGFLVLDASAESPEGREVLRHDRLTTLHPAWFEAQLAPPVGAAVHPESTWPWIEAPVVARPDAADSAPPSAEALFERGARAWFAQDEDGARAAWEALTTTHTEHPLAWKAAFELEHLGPLVRGLESYAALPPGALVASGAGSMCAAGVYDAPALWRTSLEYLLSMQRSDGGFRDSIYDFGGTDSLPNVYVAVTSIAAIAMLEGAVHLAPARGTPRPGDEALRARLEAGLRAAIQYSFDDARLNTEDADELSWARIYRVSLAARYAALRGDGDTDGDTDGDGVTDGDGDDTGPHVDLREVARALIAEQRESGLWAHEYANPFVTASALVALGEANALAPIEGASDALARGTAALLACRTQDGAYSYGATRAGRPPRAQIEGSVGRTPLGELALDYWDPASSIGLAKAIALSFEHDHHLAPARKYDDHTNRFQYGGFFYWYDAHARTLSIARLAATAASDAHAAFAERQRAMILAQPEIDGTFIDSHEVGKVYGTAMGLWCLALLDG